MKHTYNQFMLHASLNFALSFFGVPKINLLNKYTSHFFFWEGNSTLIHSLPVNKIHSLPVNKGNSDFTVIWVTIFRSGSKYMNTKTNN